MMLRALFQKPYKVSSFRNTYKKIFNKNECFTGASNECFNARRSELYSCCRCAGVYLDFHGIFIKPYSNKASSENIQKVLNANLLLGSTIDINKASSEFWKINMEDLKEVPSPAFWVGIGGLLPIVLPPISALLFTYSHTLAAGQYVYTAVILASMGGIKWGYLMNFKELGTWDNYRLTAVPCAIGIIALIVPKFLGYLLLIFGYLLAFIIDLATSNYPKWFIAQRGVLTNISVFFLFLAMLQSLFH